MKRIMLRRYASSVPVHVHDLATASAIHGNVSLLARRSFDDAYALLP
jgi:hypothetical protein